jgi:myosin heavy subunit
MDVPVSQTMQNQSWGQRFYPSNADPTHPYGEQHMASARYQQEARQKQQQLSSELSVMEERLNQMQTKLGPESLRDVQNMVMAIDTMILPELDQVARACSLELGNEQLYLQQRQLNRRADILRQRLVLLTRAYQTSSSQTVPSTLNRSFEQQRATAPPPPQPPLEQEPGLNRSYSLRSSLTMSALESIKNQLSVCEAQSQSLKMPEDRDQLAAIYGKVERMLMQDIDGVATSELTSGQRDARSERKALVHRAEALLTCLAELQQSKAPLDEAPVTELEQPPSAQEVRFDEDYEPNSQPLVHRAYSKASIRTLETIEALNNEMHSLEVAASRCTPGDPRHKDEIAQLYGTVDRLLTRRIDAVATSELHSGQEDAKVQRKELVRRGNKLLDQLEDLKGQIA